MSSDTQRQKQDRLYHLNDLAMRLPPGDGGGYNPILKNLVDSRLKYMMAELPDGPFRVQPDPFSWEQNARARKANEQILRQAVFRIEQSLRHSGVGANVYGGLKSSRGVRQKLKGRESSPQSLDLWDVIRLRVVAPCLLAVAVIGVGLQHEYGEAVLRFRNYFTNPRSEGDLYRAIHLIVIEGDRFVEIQLMTTSRELVCELDHAVAFKRRLDPLGRSHLNWLRRLSLAANYYDAMLPEFSAQGGESVIETPPGRVPSAAATAN